MESPDPTIHPLPAHVDSGELVRELTSRERERAQPGVHVVVHVTEGGNAGYARVVAPGSPGDGSQRWLHHARRGSSPGGWSELHHPRTERAVGAWKDQHESALDRVLIERSKDAWRMERDAPYVVEFPPAPLSACGIHEAPGS